MPVSQIRFLGSLICSMADLFLQREMSLPATVQPIIPVRVKSFEMPFLQCLGKDQRLSS